MSDTAIDERMLKHLQGLAGGNGSLRRGQLIVPTVHEKEDPVVRFLRASGEGWLQTSGSRSIRLLPSSLSESQREQFKAEWPIAGERWDGYTSIHLRRVAHGWVAAEIKREESAEGYVREVAFLGNHPQWREHGEQRRLRYEVAYAATDSAPDDDATSHASGTVLELRPVQFRFLGFDPPLGVPTAEPLQQSKPAIPPGTARGPRHP